MTVAATVSVTQDDIFGALGQFIDSLGLTVPIPQPPGTLPVEVIRLPVNRVATPRRGFIAMSPAAQVRLKTNEETYIPPASPTELIAGAIDQLMATRIEVQLDCYGPTAGDWANILCNVLRSNYACGWFADNVSFDIAPLYADDPRQIPLVNGEDQYEERWILTAALQSNPVTNLSQQYSGALGPVTIYDASSGDA
jgi:hypothetical protein